MKEILVIWNATNNKVEIANTLYKFLVKSTSEITLDHVQSQNELDERLNDQNKFAKYSALIVLCELTWEGKKYSEFYGIELVQQQIRVKYNNRKTINLPVLFVSFCSKNKIIEKDTTKEIINTYGLGNHFIQLPHATNIELALLWKMPRVSELELIDTLHFCSLDKMVASVRHSILYSPVEVLKFRLTSIISKAGGFDLCYISKRLEICSTKEDIKQICDHLESKFVSNLHISDSSQNTTEYKVLLVDDEETDDLRKLIEEAANYNVLISFKNNTEGALRELEEDLDNKYSVIISDYRIYDKPGDLYNRVALYPQGYTFIEQVSKQGNLYKYISFSGLPRAFRIAVAERLNVKIETADKELMIGTEQGRKSFIDKIIDLAEENLDQLSSMASDDFYFKTLYKRIITEKISVEETISMQAKVLIDKLTNIKNIENSENDFAKYWRVNKSKFSLQSETDLSKPDGVFYVEELTKLYKVVFADLRSKKIDKSDMSTLDNIVLPSLKANEKNGATLIKLYNSLDTDAKLIFYNQKDSTNKNQNIATEVYNQICRYSKSICRLKSEFPNTIGGSKNPYTQDALDKFIGKLEARRFAIYCFYWLSVKYVTQCFPKGIKGLNHAVNKILVNGHLDTNPQKGKKDNNICNKIFIGAREGKRDVSELKSIAMTNEEKIFFRNNYPELYNIWRS